MNRRRQKKKGRGEAPGKKRTMDRAMADRKACQSPKRLTKKTKHRNPFKYGPVSVKWITPGSSNPEIPVQVGAGPPKRG